MAMLTEEDLYIDMLDAPGMDEVCYGDDACEACQRFNAGRTCPCGYVPDSPDEDYNYLVGVLEGGG